MGDRPDQTPRRYISPERLLIAVCELHRVNVEDVMDADAQTRPLQTARRVFVLACRQQGRTWSDIARALGRDERTSSVARSSVERFKTDPGYDWDAAVRSAILHAGGMP